MPAPGRDDGQTPPCPSPLGLPPGVTEAPSQTLENIREDLAKFWNDVRSDLNVWLHQQELAALERLELLEHALKHQSPLGATCAHSYSTGDACGSGARCIRASSPSQYEEASRVQARQSKHSSCGSDSRPKSVSQQVLEEVRLTEQRTNGLARLQSSSMTMDFLGESGARSASLRAVEVAKEYSGRRFPPLEDKDSVVARFARSWKFSVLVATLICVNAFTIGVSANLLVGESFATYLSRPSTALAIVVPDWNDIFFACVFTLECALQIYAERSGFFFGPHWRWNAFDLFLVVSNLVEFIAETTSLSYVRTLRLLRIVHVLQVIRVLRVFDVLRHMVYAVLNSLLSIGWIIMVLALVFYLYGVFLISIVGQHVQDLPKEPEPSTHIRKLDKLFGNLSRSMLSLLEGVTGGRNWNEIIELLIGIHWIHGVTFVLFFIFITLGVLNIVTGIFVERATELTKMDKETTIMKQLDETQSLVQDIKSFFHQVDSDSSGTITWEEFREQLHDRKVHAYFMTMGIDIQSAIRVFQMLDRKGNGTVEIRDFVEGCIRLKGAARSSDVCMLLQDVRRLSHMVEALVQYTEEELVAKRSMVSNGQASPTGHSIGQASPTGHSIGPLLTQLTVENAQRSSFHKLVHAFNDPQAEPDEEALPPVPKERGIAVMGAV